MNEYLISRALYIHAKQRFACLSCLFRFDRGEIFYAIYIYYIVVFYKVEIFQRCFNHLVNGNISEDVARDRWPCWMIFLREKRSSLAGGAGKLPRGQSKVRKRRVKTTRPWERFRWPCRGHLSSSGAPELSIKSQHLETPSRVTDASIFPEIKHFSTNRFLEL